MATSFVASEGESFTSFRRKLGLTTCMGQRLPRTSSKWDNGVSMDISDWHHKHDLDWHNLCCRHVGSGVWRMDNTACLLQQVGSTGHGLEWWKALESLGCISTVAGHLTRPDVPKMSQWFCIFRASSISILHVYRITAKGKDAPLM